MGQSGEKAKHASEESTHKWCKRLLAHEHEYIMHNANTTAPTLTHAIVAAVLSLVLSLGSLLKAVAIISNLERVRETKKGTERESER